MLLQTTYKINQYYKTNPMLSTGGSVIKLCILLICNCTKFYNGLCVSLLSWLFTFVT